MDIVKDKKPWSVVKYWNDACASYKVLTLEKK